MSFHSNKTPPLLNQQSVQERGTGGEAVRLGETAHRLLSREFNGRVLAVVSQAVYLADYDDEILWLAYSKSPAHTRAILGAFEFSQLQTGMRCQSVDGTLQFEDGSRIELNNAAVWRAAPIDSVIPFSAMRERTQRLLRELTLAIPHDGLAPLLYSTSDNRSVDLTNPLIRAAHDPIREIREAIATCDTGRAVRAALPLVGLGTGLTPSGDDLLGGLFFSWRQLHVTYPRRVSWNPQILSELLIQARTRTNLISYTLLHDHFDGDAAEPLHSMFAFLVSGDNQTGWTHLERLLSIGHTSGWDMLTGVLLALLSFI